MTGATEKFVASNTAADISEDNGEELRVENEKNSEGVESLEDGID